MVLLVGFGVVSCGENAPPGQTKTQLQTQDSNSKAGDDVRTVSQSRQALPAQPVISGPTAPAGAEWTLMCDRVDGPAHVEDAALLKSRLVQISKMPDWYVIHGDRDSTLYYGYYRSFDHNPTEKQRADQDRAKIIALTDKLGNRLVRGPAFVSVAAPDPTAPPEWNVLNAPKNAYWTMEIATFSGNALRKEAAVQAVRELRERGEKAAFYYHGETSSSVLIGAWPREAVAEQGTGIDRKGNLRDDAHGSQADRPLWVYGGIDQAPPNVAGQVLEPGTGKPMTVMGLKLDILDPDLKAKTKEYPYHYVNYALHSTQAPSGQEYPDPSVLVVIPRQQASSGQDDWQLTGGAQRAPADVPLLTQPQGSSAAGDSVLRSIGDR
jgi:hypothetical protein